MSSGIDLSTDSLGADIQQNSCVPTLSFTQKKNAIIEQNSSLSTKLGNEAVISGEALAINHKGNEIVPSLKKMKSLGQSSYYLTGF